MRHHFVLAFALALVACAHSSSSTTPDSRSTQSGRRQANGLTADQYLERAFTLFRDHRWAEAIEEGFDPAIAAFERQYPEPGPIDRALEAATMAISEQLAGQGMVITSDAPPTMYPDALYFAAYSSIELGDIVRAEAYLQRALVLIPDDPFYLCELGHIAATKSQWPESLDLFVRAERSARSLDAELHDESWMFLGQNVAAWVRRSMRGQGFALVEMGRFDDAEAIYRRVLELDPGDAQARRELDLIARQRSSSRL